MLHPVPNQFSVLLWRICHITWGTPVEQGRQKTVTQNFVWDPHSLNTENLLTILVGHHVPSPRCLPGHGYLKHQVLSENPVGARDDQRSFISIIQVTCCYLFLIDITTIWFEEKCTCMKQVMISIHYVLFILQSNNFACQESRDPISARLNNDIPHHGLKLVPCQNAGVPTMMPPHMAAQASGGVLMIQGWWWSFYWERQMLTQPTANL